MNIDLVKKYNRSIPSLFIKTVNPGAKRSISDFAEDEVVLPKGPRKGMRFDTNYMPLVQYIFDAIEDPHWRRIAVAAPTQQGKSLICTNIPMLYFLFEKQEDIIFGIPNMDLATGMYKEKILPVIENTRFKDYLPKRGAGAKGGIPTAINFTNGTTLRFMGAGGGDAQRSSHTSRVIIISETDKLDDIGNASEEADPVSQIEMRADAFEDGKIIMECTVTHEHGRIWNECMVNGSAGQLHVPCPKCNHWQTLTKDYLTFDATDLISAEETARYKCSKCDQLWDDNDRRTALETPLLVHKGQEIENGKVINPLPRTRTFGLHFNVLYSPMQSLGKTAAQQFEADNSELKEKKKAMIQSKWALPWKEDNFADRNVTFTFLKHRMNTSHVSLNELPSWMDWLVMEVDVQKRLLYWHCEAYKADGTSQMIEYGVIEYKDESDRSITSALDQAHDIAQEGWKTKNGETTFTPRISMVDTGYRYDVIGPWLKQRVGWIGVKGVGRGKGRPHGSKASFQIPGIMQIRRLPDGNRIWFIEVDQTKAIIHDRFFLEEGQSGYTYFPNQVSQGYMMSLSAEQRVFEPDGETFKWEKVPGRRRNDYLDCRSYGVAAGMFLAQVKDKEDKKVETEVKVNTEKMKKPQPPKRNWFKSTGRFYD